MIISGNVIDTEQMPLMGVNIVLLDDSNKPMSVGGATDYDGNFNIDVGNVPSGQKVRLSYIGFNPVIKTVSELKNGSVKMYEILEPLDTVTVIAKKTPVKTTNYVKIASIIALVLGASAAGYVIYKLRTNG